MTTQLQEKPTKDDITNSDLIFIKQIKMKPDGTADISYKREGDDFSENITASGQNVVATSFSSIFQQAIDGFIDCCPLFFKEKSKLKMTAIKFDYDKSNALKGAAYFVDYVFGNESNAKLECNTLSLPIYEEKFGSVFAISGKHEKILHEIIKEAKWYLQGKTRTSQLTLIK